MRDASLGTRWCCSRRSFFAHFNNLSDDQVGYQVRDRLSFIRFLGLGLEDNVPDAKAVSGLWADSAYWSAEIKAKLEGKGLKSRIHRKGHRNKPLTEREMQAAGAAG